MTDCKATNFGYRRRTAQMLRRFRDDESGATAIEYGLIVSLIFLAVVGAVRGMSGETVTMYGEIEGAMSSTSE